MERVAQCHCGQVKITCTAEPAPILMCSCQLCQRRTGGPFHIGAWFNRSEVRIEGRTKTFTRTSGDKGREVTFDFCPECGTSIWWGGKGGTPIENRIGISVGCFADPEFPPPTHSFYEKREKRRHPWITPAASAVCLAEGTATAEEAMALMLNSSK